MAKRKTFYVSAAIFDTPHTAYAVAVYAYLSFCADKQGVCFPGMETIAERCGLARSTVKKAMTELELSGLIQTEATRQTSKSGKTRRGTNRYRLLNTPVPTIPQRSCDGVPSTVTRCTPPSCDGVPLPRETAYPPPCDDGEINNNSKLIMGDVPSVVTNARDMTDRDGLDAVLEKLYLDSFFDQDFAQSVKQTIRNMYGAPYVTVNGRRVERDAVRRRLNMLTVDHIDYVEKQLEEHGGEVQNGERYLTSCIFNAPIDTMVKNACVKNF